jgi:hypothetical protein
MAELRAKVTTTFKDSSGRFTAHVHEAIRRAMLEACELGAEESRRLAPDGGPQPWKHQVKLQDSIEVINNGAQVGWGSSAPHAAAIEFGAGPHGIDGNPLLGWFWGKHDGRMVKAKHVEHPGNAPHPFLMPAFEEIKSQLADIIRSNM